jgi:hypothetical protein
VHLVGFYYKNAKASIVSTATDRYKYQLWTAAAKLAQKQWMLQQTGRQSQPTLSFPNYTPADTFTARNATAIILQRCG